MKPEDVKEHQLPNLATDTICEMILKLEYEEPARIMIPIGEGDNTVARVRVKFMRVKKKLRARNMKFKHFRIHTRVFPHETLDDKDWLVIWTSQSANNRKTEIIDDVVANQMARESE